MGYGSREEIKGIFDGILNAWFWGGVGLVCLWNRKKEKGIVVRR